MAEKRSRFERNIRVKPGQKKKRKRNLSKSSAFKISKSKPPIQNFLNDIYDEWGFEQFERGLPNQEIYRVKKQPMTELWFDKFGNQDIEVRIDAVDEEGYHTITFLANGPGCKQKMEQRKIDYLNKEKEKEERLEAKRLAERQKKIEKELLRFGHLRELAKELNIGSLYIIELRDEIRWKGAVEKAYPCDDYPPTDLHGAESRNFYVGITSKTPEERFCGSGENHMSSHPGKVYKHRLIQDPAPYTKSLAVLEKLTEEYGYRGISGGDAKDFRFEHYLAWSLYKIGHRTWGPKVEELKKLNMENRNWLGKEPFC